MKLTPLNKAKSLIRKAEKSGSVMMEYLGEATVILESLDLSSTTKPKGKKPVGRPKSTNK